MRSALEAAEWVDGRTTAGYQSGRVKDNMQLPDDHPLARELSDRILSALERNPLFMGAALPLRVFPPLFNRYEGGEHYGLHIDGAMRALPQSGQWLRTDLSCTLFLCEPDDYEGGELVVVDTYGTHEVKLPAGDLILYPSSSLHQVLPVTRGARVCSFFWTQSLVQDDAQRAMLFELDTQVQRLRASLGDTAEVLSLTGIYHNLLRKWGQA